MPEAAKKLFLLDAFALIYRAHFAFAKKPRINSKGINTSAPFGFTNTLLEVLQKQEPSHIGVVFDTPKATFRETLFELYKANRDEAPEDVRQSLPLVRDIIAGFNIPILECDGYEADDVIGTIASKAAQAGFQVYMMTMDKDMGQLVGENVFLYKPSYMGESVKVMGVAEICQRWDIAHVGQVIDILGLQGDASDNIPGVPGIGPKTAAALLAQYGTVENVLAHTHQLKGKQREQLEKYGQQAMLSKRLATIVTDAPVAFDEAQLCLKPPNREALKALFETLEFKTLAVRALGVAQMPMPAPSPAAPDVLGIAAQRPVPFTRHMSPTPEERKTLAAQLMEQRWFAFEALTSGDVHAAFTLKGIALAFSQTSVYLPIASEEEARATLAALTPALVSPRIGKVGYGIKHFVLALKRYPLALQGPLFDTMLAHYLLEPEISHELEGLLERYLGREATPTDNDRQAACGRVEGILGLADRLKKELEERGQYKLMSDVEAPLIFTLADMEHEGIRVKEESLARLAVELRGESEKLQEEIYTLAGVRFNVASPKQVGEILFDQLKLADKPKRTKTGHYATGEEVLAKLAYDHPIVSKMLEFREYEKLRSTYVEALPKMIRQPDQRIHTDYRQAVAATGRLSSVNPNLQNIPIRTAKGREIRKAFVPRDKDYVLMSADYSQIELRIAASFAQDATMMEAFSQGRDIHAATAAKIFNVKPHDVMPDMRRKAKEVNFGILYGSGAFGLAQNLSISRVEAAAIIDSYFREFGAIRRYMDESIEQARKKGYVETLLGRRRYLRDINSRNAAMRGFAERNAINAPIQGSAADIIKIAMLHIHAWLKRESLRTKMLLQVHDELVFDLYRPEENIVKPKVTELMTTAALLAVPMEVEIGVGENWLAAH